MGQCLTVGRRKHVNKGSLSLCVQNSDSKLPFGGSGLGDSFSRTGFDKMARKAQEDA